MLVWFTVSCAGPPTAYSSSAPDWNTRFLAYADDPVHNRHEILTLRRHRGSDMPLVVQLALGDALLRARRYPEARATFAAVLRQSPGPPWGDLAALSLGWTGLATGDLALARRRFGDVAASESPNVPIGEFALGLLDAGDGRPEAGARFVRVVDAPGIPPDLREAATFAAVLALYWAGDYALAADGFDALAGDGTGTPFADDAAYAAAWSRVRGVDRARGRVELERLATRPTTRPSLDTTALANLEPQALIRAAFERYRRGPLEMPAHMLAQILNNDGPSLARAGLRLLDQDPSLPDPLAAWRGLVVGKARAGPSAMLAPAVGAPHADSPSMPSPANPSRVPWNTRSQPAIMAAAVIVVIGWLGWRRRARPSHGDR